MRYMVNNPKTDETYEAIPQKIIATVASNFEISEKEAEHIIASHTIDEPLLLYSGEEVWTEE